MLNKFALERFKNSCIMLDTLVKNKYKFIEGNIFDFDSSLLRGCFMDCVENLYGFVPELFSHVLYYSSSKDDKSVIFKSWYFIITTYKNAGGLIFGGK